MAEHAMSELAAAGLPGFALNVSLRPVSLADAAALAELYRAQGAFLEPFGPVRPAAFLTPEGQREAIVEELRLVEEGRRRGFVIVAGPTTVAGPATVAGPTIVGVVTLSNIVRGGFQNANVGYFVAREWNGRGIATRAVGLACGWAFGDGGLHRLEAATLVDNVASQHVLFRNGFERVGLARRYLQIAGEWRDHILFARLATEPARP